MKVGSMYRYKHAGGQKQSTIIFVYEVAEAEFVPQGLIPAAFGVNIQDSSDIRKIPHYFWQYWTKVK